MTDALLETMALKALLRSGWVRRGVRAPESVAAHSWGVAWLVLVLLPDGLDLARALSYAVLHDLPEVRVGDLTPHDGVQPEVKARREHAAMQAITASLPRGPALLATWEAYEAQRDPEARFVRQLDRLDMALQAVAYARSGNPGLGEFLDSAERAIVDPELRRWLVELRAAMAAIPGSS